MRDQCWLDKKIDNSTYESFSIEKTDAIAQNIIEEMHDLFPNIQEVSTNATVRFVIVNNDDLKDEGFEILIDDKVSIQAQTTRGLLYGMYRFYQSVVLEEVKSLVSIPDQSIRMIDHWDNINGSIERGYAGASIFYQDNHFRRDFSLIRAYARLLASVGINALTLNNVNVHQIETRFVLEEFYPEIRMLSDIFAQFGIKTFLCVNFAAPKLAGGLETADPLAPEVIRFWETVTKNIYRAIPDFGGFVVKADSEGGHGPFFYGRDHAEGANMFARALEPYQGIVIWRCFVYNHKQDWRDRKTDRARAAYDHFKPLDGKFADNVILQIKLGPLDFQVREPVSPLFGALRNTNHMIEFQLTQEYTGQQKAVYFQVPVWKEVLDFDTKYDYSPSVVRELIKHNSPQPKHSGICAVGLVGMDQNWTGHKLAQSNLFAFGRMTWDNTLTSEKIADEWIRLTFALSKDGYDKVLDILTTSREVYALYTAPRGVGFMISPSQHHYGPSVNGYEYDRWGTYHFADRDGVGVDRTMNGTKYVEQYAKPRFEEYNQLSTCPDEFLLWFHHVPYHHVLHNGKTLIQDIYDTHFEGVARVEKFIEKWSSLQDEVDEVSYQNVSERLTEQLRVAIEWRDQINTYFYRMSGIKDQHGRMIYP